MLGRVQAGRQCLAVIVSCPGRRQRDLGDVPDRVDGCRKLMGDVVGEPLQAAKGVLEPVEHDIEGPGQTAQFGGQPVGGDVRSPNRSGPICPVVAAISSTGRRPRRAITMPATADAAKAGASTKAM
jgi:hypothetical protein